jgi:hypothetical protein
MNDYLKQRMLDAEEQGCANLVSAEGSKRTPHTVFIAFSGKKQCGKDTAADMAAIMLNEAGKDVIFTAFAESLKEMCIRVLGLKRLAVYGDNATKDAPCHIKWDGFSSEIRKKYAVAWIPARRDSLDPRRHMIDEPCVKQEREPVPRVGPMSTREVLQVMGTDVFRSIYNDVWAESPFNRDWGGYDVVLLTDCRFPNEKMVTEENGGVIIRLERDTGYVDEHLSETALDNETFDILYQNNGTLEDLRAFVRQTLEKLQLV